MSYLVGRHLLSALCDHPGCQFGFGYEPQDAPVEIVAQRLDDKARAAGWIVRRDDLTSPTEHYCPAHDPTKGASPQ